MLRRTLFTLFVILPLAFVVGFGCISKDGTQVPWPETPGPRVVVTFAPLYSFVKSVMGDRGHIKTILETTGPHEYHPTFDDARTIDGADLFFFNGLNLEGNLISTIQNARPHTKVKFIDLGGKLDKNTLLDDEDTHGNSGDAHGYDPHVWLGINNAKRMVEAIRDELKAFDPSCAGEYDRNAAAYVAKLEQLKVDGRKLLSCIPEANRKFVAMHDSLGYFVKSFGLRIEGVIELSPGQEPSRMELDKLIETCTKKKVRVIALEPQYASAGGARTLERELKRRGLNPVLVVIDPLETATPDEFSADLYEKVMRSNLAILAEALKNQ
ncbi:MAG TPA: metal ABC transporter substrate-binding protein [Fimbriiglobus sp.]|jgi:ABC-type Zn uptake system ZnuABC Zn-binding protein ZnuA